MPVRLLSSPVCSEYGVLRNGLQRVIPPAPCCHLRYNYSIERGRESGVVKLAASAASMWMVAG
jgi:hypothetical protein